MSSCWSRVMACALGPYPVLLLVSRVFAALTRRSQCAIGRVQVCRSKLPHPSEPGPSRLEAAAVGTLWPASFPRYAPAGGCFNSPHPPSLPSGSSPHRLSFRGDPLFMVGISPIYSSFVPTRDSEANESSRHSEPTRSSNLTILFNKREVPQVQVTSDNLFVTSASVS